MAFTYESPTKEGYYLYRGFKSEGKIHHVEIRLKDGVFKLIDWDMKGWWEPLGECGYEGQWEGPCPNRSFGEGRGQMFHMKQGE